MRLWRIQSRVVQPRFAAMGSTRFFSTQEKLFDKILIANRGEIACRVIHSAKKLGIKTVAVYSEADANSLHVKLADEAVCVGPAPSAQSYLVMDNIVAACVATGAQAVHPGYGFLSENNAFAKKLQDNNITFIGPGEYAITSMGDKIASKKIARDANVNTIPGYLGAMADEAEVLKIANEIGYPVMIKASAGGGGKGMRVAWSDAEAKDGFRMSKQEAMSSFGDDTIFLEKFIEEPRHIEIQVLCDSQGNGIWVNERECSIQRRNQKVIEEAPSVFLDAATRKAMGDQAVALAKAVDYQSAGTVEFLVDKHRNFYFLEMNTRLQVEHPVTELISDIDLVEEMIRVAAGHPLAKTQDDIKINGWAVESRVYAEDPKNDFLPSIGRLDRYVEPEGVDGSVRVDSGVREGGEISIYYDPLISKLITYAPTRAEAIDRMRDALDTYVIRGVTSNVCFLRALMDHPKWLSGDITTAFIEEEYPDGFKGIDLTTHDHQVLVSSAVLNRVRQMSTQLSINGQQSGFDATQLQETTLADLVVRAGGLRLAVSVQSCNVDLDKGEFAATMVVEEEGKEATTIEASGTVDPTGIVLDVVVGGQKSTIQILEASDDAAVTSLQYKGNVFPVEVRTRRHDELQSMMPVVEELDVAKFILSPMPGAIFSVNVKEGDKVVAGQEVAVIEAMKMQNAIRAVKPATVKAVHVKPGQTVAAEELLVELDTD